MQRSRHNLTIRQQKSRGRKTAQTRDAIAEEIAYWQSRPTLERFARVWELTKEAYGITDSARLDKTKVRFRRNAIRN